MSLENTERTTFTPNPVLAQAYLAELQGRMKKDASPEGMIRLREVEWARICLEKGIYGAAEQVINKEIMDLFGRFRQPHLSAVRRIELLTNTRVAIEALRGITTDVVQVEYDLRRLQMSS